MSKVENNIDIYYAVGKANTLRKEYELITIMKKRNSAWWKFISTITAKVDTKKRFQIFIYFGKRISKQYFRYLIPLAVKLYISHTTLKIISYK